MGEKFQRPTASQGMLEEDCNSFLLQWEIYKEGANLTTVTCGKQLIYCCDQELLKFVLGDDPGARLKTRQDPQHDEDIGCGPSGNGDETL